MAASAMTSTMIRRERGIATTSEISTDAPVGDVLWRAASVDAGGAILRTFETGNPTPGAPAVLMIHGMGQWTQIAWDRLVPYFATTHRVLAFDLPGFGASSKPQARYTLTYFTSALRAVVASFDVRTFGLLGHSLGGLIAANYAAIHPDRVSALGLLGPAGFLRTPHLAARIAGSGLALGLRAEVRAPRALVRSQIRRATFERDAMSERELDHAYALGTDAAIARSFMRVYAGAAYEFFNMRTTHARFSAYGGPVTVVWGRNDRFIPSRALRVAARVYRQADTLMIRRCGHCPGIEYPSLVAERLKANGF